MFAREKGLPVHQPKSWKTPEALELMKSFNADVCMMAYVLLFVPQPVLDAPTLGTFQYHPSLLPLHRGPSSINWPIAMGKTQTGLSIFWPDEGLDEGPILMQKTVDIGPDETLGDVYFKKLFPIGVDAMMEWLDLVQAPARRRKHDAGLARRLLRKLVQEGHRRSSTGRSRSATVYNIIRAANPAPGAWAMIKGTEVDIFDAAKAPGDGKPGEILAITDDGITIAAKGGAILAKRVQGGRRQEDRRLRICRKRRPQGRRHVRRLQAGTAAGAEKSQKRETRQWPPRPFAATSKSRAKRRRSRSRRSAPSSASPPSTCCPSATTRRRSRPTSSSRSTAGRTAS